MSIRRLGLVAALLLLAVPFQAMMTTVRVHAPISADFVPAAATVGQSVQFTGTVTGSSARPFTLDWDMTGDGQPEATCLVTSSTGFSCSAAWTFALPGNHSVTLRARDSTGSVAPVVTHSVKVTAPPPLSIVPKLTKGPQPGDIFSVKVVLGNSTNAVNDLDAWGITVTYDTSVLTAIGPTCAGSSCTAADYHADPPFDSYQIFQTPALDDTAGTIKIGAAFINFPTVGPSGSGALAQLDFVVDVAGRAGIGFFSPDLKLRSTIIDSFNNFRIITIQPVKIATGFFTSFTANPPFAGFDITSPPQGARTINATITFDASSSVDPDGFIISYKWDFGDTNTTTAVVPTIFHRYTQEGAYPVTLTVTDNDTAALTGSTTHSLVIFPPVSHRNIPPEAIFSPDKTTVKVGEQVTFDALESKDTDGCLYQFRWNFGDGTVIIQPDAPSGCIDPHADPPLPGVVVTHIYTSNGTYSVNLTVYDNEGAASNPYAVTIQVGERHLTQAGNPTIYYIGGGLAAALVAGLGFFARRRKASLKAMQDSDEDDL